VWQTVASNQTAPKFSVPKNTYFHSWTEMIQADKLGDNKTYRSPFRERLWKEYTLLKKNYKSDFVFVRHNTVI
jgi:hypothetical protein